jgi:hypothetical protein
LHGAWSGFDGYRLIAAAILTVAFLADEPVFAQSVDDTGDPA